MVPETICLSPEQTMAFRLEEGGVDLLRSIESSSSSIWHTCSSFIFIMVIVVAVVMVVIVVK